MKDLFRTDEGFWNHCNSQLMRTYAHLWLESGIGRLWITGLDAAQFVTDNCFLHLHWNPHTCAVWSKTWLTRTAELSNFRTHVSQLHLTNMRFLRFVQKARWEGEKNYFRFLIFCNSIVDQFAICVCPDELFLSWNLAWRPPAACVQLQLAGGSSQTSSGLWSKEETCEHFTSKIRTQGHRKLHIEAFASCRENLRLCHRV